MAINRVTLTGNLTRDPEMRATSNGTQIMSFTIAVNDRRRNQQTGVWEEYPNFVGCVMFGRRAEALGRYLAKGRKVAVEGSLRYSTWTSDGAKRSKLEVVIDDLELMSSSRSEGQATSAKLPQKARRIPTSLLIRRIALRAIRMTSRIRTSSATSITEHRPTRKRCRPVPLSNR